MQLLYYVILIICLVVTSWRRTLLIISTNAICRRTRYKMQLQRTYAAWNVAESVGCICVSQSVHVENSRFARVSVVPSVRRGLRLRPKLLCCHEHVSLSPPSTPPLLSSRASLLALAMEVLRERARM